MKQSFEITRALLLGLLTLACGTRAADDGDAGIVIPDAGSEPSADAGSDAGMGDGGVEVCGSTVGDVTTDWPALPDTCVPRCTADTDLAISECAMLEDDAARIACAVEAVRSDPTPTVYVDTFYGPLPVNCGGSDYDADPYVYSCTEWAVYACDAWVCPTEYYNWAVCGGCAEWTAALDACRAGSEHEMCRFREIGRCYP